MRHSVWIVCLCLCFFLNGVVDAQPEEQGPPIEFLYRDGQSLGLINGFTGESRLLPNIIAEEGDNFLWSPNGDYILARFYRDRSGPPIFCVNIYSMATEDWVYQYPIACHVTSTLFLDNTTFFYTQSVGYDAVLWQFDWVTGIPKRLYFARNTVPNHGVNLYAQEVSPTEQYLVVIDN